MKRDYEIGISPDKTFVYAQAFRQPYTLELALAVARELNPLGKKFGVLGCLIDIRGTKSVTSNFEKYEFAQKQANHVGVPRHWRIALLKDADDDSPNFLETVMKNAGYSFKIFKDKLRAIEWLKEA